ncbi:hypothetical protein M0804_000001 [Polistes exclamans]|nr:hypothetical protein M0804_000001 [Polistes exclamans]
MDKIGNSPQLCFTSYSIMSRLKAAKLTRYLDLHFTSEQTPEVNDGLERGRKLGGAGIGGRVAAATATAAAGGRYNGGGVIGKKKEQDFAFLNCYLYLYLSIYLSIYLLVIRRDHHPTLGWLRYTTIFPCSQKVQDTYVHKRVRKVGGWVGWLVGWVDSVSLVGGDSGGGGGGGGGGGAGAGAAATVSSADRRAVVVFLCVLVVVVDASQCPARLRQACFARYRDPLAFRPPSSMLVYPLPREIKWPEIGKGRNQRKPARKRGDAIGSNIRVRTRVPCRLIDNFPKERVTTDNYDDNEEEEDDDDNDNDNDEEEEDDKDDLLFSGGIRTQERRDRSSRRDLPYTRDLNESANVVGYYSLLDPAKLLNGALLRRA